jgi:hypothetical protein
VTASFRINTSPVKPLINHAKISLSGCNQVVDHDCRNCPVLAAKEEALAQARAKARAYKQGVRDGGTHVNAGLINGSFNHVRTGDNSCVVS